MVDVLNLPIIGQEEDAADQFAALYFSQEPVLAMWAADFWSQGGTGGSFVSMEAFADEHALDQQRFFNIMCWTYGADPLVRGFVVELSGLPLERATRCQGEYDRLRSSYERLLSGFLKDPLAFADLDPTRNASGYWRFMESMMDDERQVRCSAAGTLALWQMDIELTGSMAQDGSCVYFGAPIDNAAEETISTGSVTETGLSFEVGSCRYEGTFEDEARMSLGGSMTCSGDAASGFPELKGTWKAVR